LALADFTCWFILGFLAFGTLRSNWFKNTFAGSHFLADFWPVLKSAEIEVSKMRDTRPFVFLVLAVFIIFFLRLYQLQVMEGRRNRFLAESNRISRLSLEAPRGLLLDRHGEILATNEPVFLLEKKSAGGEAKPEEISREEALKLQAEGQDSGLRLFLRRHYLVGEAFGQVVGYLGEVTDSELKEEKLDLKGYRQGNLIGRVGVEAEYESLLRGREGSELVEVDTEGKVIRRMGRILPSVGKTLTLTVDKKLQETAAAAMEGRKGAVIAVSPQNGEVLLLYSSPGFDANLFSADNRDEVVKLINDEAGRPLLNRVTAGLFAPGSTFKIVTAIAALSEGKITPRTQITDPGVITIGDFQYHNWYFASYGKTEGEVDLTKALARSVDTYFYKVGEMVGIEKLNFWAEKFGVKKKTGIDLPGELPGFIANPEWKEKTKGEPWFLGNTYHVAIGQGDLALTPLQVNQITSAVAGEGKICRPRMLKLGAENTPYEADCRDLGVKNEFWTAIKKGMTAACAEGGTGYPFFGFTPKVACKTGTAEIGDGQSHAWFTVFAPADNPEIVLTVLVEKGGEGSSVAAPIAKEILREYFLEK
jgi:penicillin-binding protein 2